MTMLANILAEHYFFAADRPAIYLQVAGQPDRCITYSDLVCGAAGFARLLEQWGSVPARWW
jgi:hypothetical protein